MVLKKTFYWTCTIIITILTTVFASHFYLSFGKNINHNKGEVLGAFAPELPRVSVDTTLPASASTCTVTLHSGGDLQTAINDASRGDTICLEAGVTFTGNFTLPNKTTSSGWVTIRTSTPDAQFVSQGNRVAPSDASLMAKVVSSNTNPVFATDPGANHYRFIGLELTTTSSNFSWNLVYIYDDNVNNASDLPSYFVFDRIYAHSTSLIPIYRPLVLNGNNIGVIDSYISEGHVEGADAQAILSNRSAGPLKIVNNYLEAAGENILFGGATQIDAQFIPSDIEIKNNYFYKPWTWKYTSGQVLPTGTCKNDSRYSTKGENFNLLDSGDVSIAWYQCISGAWQLRDMSQPLTLWTVKNLFEIKDAQRVLFSGNVLENNWQYSQDGVCILYNGVDGSQSLIENITFKNNICRNTVNGINISSNFGSNQLRPTNTLIFENNLFEISSTGRFLSLNNSGTHDVYFNHNTILTLGTMMYVGDDVPPPLFTNFVYTNNLGTAHYYNGAGQVEADNALPYFMENDAVFTKNVVTAPAHPYTAFTDNFFPADIPTIGFVNYSNGVGGDYHLSPSSLYKNAGTDGQDVGADMDALLAEVANTITGLTVDSSGSSDTPVSSNVNTGTLSTRHHSLPSSPVIMPNFTQTSTTVIPNTIPEISKSLARGSEGIAVLSLQKTLIKLGFLSPGSDIGYFGPATEASVKAFQKKYGIVSSGTPNTNGYGSVGPATRKKINDVVSGKVSTIVMSTSTLTSNSKHKVMPKTITSNLAKGSKGPQVLLLKQFLLDNNFARGTPNDLYGDATEISVKIFQKKYGIVSSGTPATTGFGSVGSKTRLKINQILSGL